MAIDPNIALSVKPVEFESPINVMAKGLALKNAQQENQMRAFQMQQQQADLARQNALRASLQGVDITTPEGLTAARNAYVNAGDIKGHHELATGQAALEKAQREAAAAKLKLVSDKVDLGIKFLSGATDQPTYDAARKAMSDNGIDVSQMPPQFDPAYKQSELMKGIAAKDQLALHFADLGGSVQPVSNLTGAPVGAGLKKTVSPDAAARLAETQTTEKAPTVTTVQDPTDPTRTLRIDAKTYRGGAVGAPGVIGEAESTAQKLDTRERVKRDAAFPQATTAVKSVEADTDRLISQLQQLKTHPGLPNITGSVASRIPSMTPAATGAQALYDTVVSKGQFAMLQNMRNMSKTGGALGAVSDAEGKALRDSFGSLSRAQSTEEFRKRVDEVIADLERTKRTSREAYDSTYAYKQGGAAETAPAASGGWGKAVVK